MSDVRTLAAELRAKALADLKAAEEMENAVAQLEAMAAERGWKIEIKTEAPTSTVSLKINSRSGVIEATTNSAATVGTVMHGTLDAFTRNVAPKRMGKAPDPTSMTHRSKVESVKIIRDLKRPVPLSELIYRLGKIGVTLGGKNPNQALSANLGHTPELESTKRGWWLKGEPLPPEDTSPVIGRDMNLPGLN